MRATARARRAISVIAIGVALVASAAVAAEPALAAGKHKVNIHMKTTKEAGTTLKGTFRGSPLGSGTFTGKLIIPHVTLTFKGKGGTATLSYVGNQHGTRVTATWHWTKGTGRYKGISGRGRAVGNTEGTFHFTGTARY